MAVTESDIQSKLKTLVDPNTERDFVSGKSIRKVQLNGEDVAIDVVLGYPAKTQHEVIRKQIADHLRDLPGIGRITVSISHKVIAHAVQRGVKLMPTVKNIIAVASGKGGVGK